MDVEEALGGEGLGARVFAAEVAELLVEGVDAGCEVVNLLKSEALSSIQV
jgi:hypothetical protein